MTAIIAAITTDKTLPLDLVSEMLQSMPYRSADGTLVRAVGSAVLGLAYKRLLPEDPLAPTVFTDGTLNLIVHGRLDNREQLTTMLDLPAHVPEGAIFLAAYQQWGSNCVGHFLGDFAFTVLDSASGHLFAARDAMGVKPLFYRYDQAGFLLATEFRVLLAPGAPFADLKQAGPIQQQIANFVFHRPNTEHRIFYDGVMRLRAGHWLSYSPSDGLKTSQYWQPEIPATLTTASEAAPILRKLLIEAVRCRMRSTTPVATLLSGGLDSSSIAVCANKIALETGAPPVDTFSMVFDKTPKLNERPFIEAVLKVGRFCPHFLALDDYAPFKGFSAMLARQARLFHAPAMIMSNNLHAEINDAGFSVFLDGHGGDEVISHGTERLFELAERKAWAAVWRELAVIGSAISPTRMVGFFNLFIQYSGLRGTYRLRKLLTAKKAPKADQTTSDGVAGPKLIDLERALKREVRAKSEADAHVTVLRSVLLEEASEMLELASVSKGLEPRFPFYDKRVIEFCLSLPSEAKLNKGWGRFVLREAMEGLLPPKVQWRRSKFNFAPHLASGMLKHHRALMDDIIFGDADGVSAYIDLKKIQAIYGRAKSNGKGFAGRRVGDVWRTVALSLWLRHEKTNV
jgi:asparagine synthase (glutamine-hydrolysing)